MRSLRRELISAAICTVVMAPAVWAQSPAELRQVLNRLDRLEAQNQELLSEIKALREQLGGNSQAASPAGAPAPTAAEVPAEERGEVQERRIAELDQAKVGSDHKLPVSLTGMVLFNAFLNGKGAGGGQYPVLASSLRQSSAGGSF